MPAADIEGSFATEVTVESKNAGTAENDICEPG